MRSSELSYHCETGKAGKSGNDFLWVLELGNERAGFGTIELT